MILCDKRDRNFMPRTAITLKFKLRSFQNEGATQLKSCKQI